MWFYIHLPSLLPSSWHFFPSVSVILRKHKSSCIFCIAKIIPFWVPKAVLSASAAPLGCSALCWHWSGIHGDCVWATSRSRADLCRLCFAAVSVSFTLILLCLAHSGTDVISPRHISLSAGGAGLPEPVWGCGSCSSWRERWSGTAVCMMLSKMVPVCVTHTLCLRAVETEKYRPWSAGGRNTSLAAVEGAQSLVTHCLCSPFE